MNVYVWKADCLEALAQLDDESIDAICTDPPYELSFMSKKWDGTQIAYNIDLWKECLRVLKPGGHLLSFGGTRTYHRMACAVEDAGFELRDSVMWVYGSGFPKSQNVSKAIDKAAGRQGTAVATLKKALRDCFDASPLTHSAIDKACGFRASNYLTIEAEGKRPDPWINTVPTAEKWATLKRVLGIEDDYLDDYFAAAKREVIGAEREVIGKKSAIPGVAFTSVGPNELDITAPATDASKEWEGWGTALKPAHENVICARKPLTLEAILTSIDSHLDRLETECKSIVKPADESFVHSRRESSVARIDSARGNAATQHAEVQDNKTVTGQNAGDSSAQTDTSPFESTETTCLSIVTSWRRCLDVLWSHTNTSTTQTESSTITDLKTLCYWLSQTTAEHMRESATKVDGSQSLAWSVDNLFAAVVLRLNATQTPFAAERAGSMMQNSEDGQHAADVGSDSSGQVAASSADKNATQLTEDASNSHEPIVVARKPLIGTVAKNVQTHGTGALNIDGCRVAGEPRSTGTKNPHHAISGVPGIYGIDARTGRHQNYDANKPSGRWPPNLAFVHSEFCTDETCSEDCAVAELDRQSGNRPTGDVKHYTRKNRDSYSGSFPAINTFERKGDSGGASRFFPAFRYQPKSPKRERPTVEGISHPTVKPLELIKWLVRLVTPPGGIVLDPFVGSGTTLEAAYLEGFLSIGIENYADYIKLIEARFEQYPELDLKVIQTEQND